MGLLSFKLFQSVWKSGYVTRQLPWIAASFSLAAPSAALDLYVDTLPQSTSQTCQSYSAMLALAARKDPALPIDTFDELRAHENEFRKILTQIDPNGVYAHTNWKLAMEKLTGGKYTLKIRYIPSITDWMTAVRDATTMSSDIGAFMSTLSGGRMDVVLTSVKTIDGSTYGGSTGSHIITVLGLSGSGLNSATQLIAFNSAIKGQGSTANSCSTNGQPGDMRYKAGVVQTNNFTLTDFSGLGILVMTLEEM